MAYEFCLEYGSYPIQSLDNGNAIQQTSIPAFLADDSELLALLETINQKFHALFLVIENQFHYVGGDTPEVLEDLKALYRTIAQKLESKYPQEKIRIQPFLWT